MSLDITTEQVRIAVGDGTTMSALLTRPGGLGARPGILLLQEIFGVNDHIQRVAARLAGEGYTVLAPDLFHRTHPGYQAGYEDIGASVRVAMKYGGAQSEADLRAALAHLEQLEGVQGDRLAALGFCMGGRLAFCANAYAPLRCAVSFYGGGISPDKIHLAPALSGHTLFFWAGKDAYIPVEQQAAVLAELRRLAKPFTSVEVSYANHGFFCDARSDYDPAAAAQAWALTREFLRSHLGTDKIVGLGS